MSSSNVCRFSATQSWEKLSLVIRSWSSCVLNKLIWKLSSSLTLLVTTTSSSASCNVLAKLCHTFHLKSKQRRSSSLLATSSSHCQHGIWLEQLTISNRLNFACLRCLPNCARTVEHSRSQRKESKPSSTCCWSSCRRHRLMLISPKLHRSCFLTSNACFSQFMLWVNNVPSTWHSLMIPQSWRISEPACNIWLAVRKGKSSLECKLGWVFNFLCISSYVKKLQEDIKGNKPSDPKTEEEKLKIIGLKTTSNIQTLIRDLFHSPPSFKSVVRLSWVTPKPKNLIKVAAADAVEEKTPAPGAKRHAPITFSNGDAEDTRGAKQAKGNNGQQMYSPPGGKFSSKFKGGNQKGGNRSRNAGGNNRFRSGGGGGNGGNRNNKNFRRN